LSFANSRERVCFGRVQTHVFLQDLELVS